VSRRDLLTFLDWLATQPFDAQVVDRGLSHGSLLRTAEHVVVRDHALLFGELAGGGWTVPKAYRWIRYEDPDPAARLADAGRRLEREWLAAQARQGYDEVSRRALAHIGEHLGEMVRRPVGLATRADARAERCPKRPSCLP
jgi:hypothetical protein